MSYGTVGQARFQTKRLSWWERLMRALHWFWQRIVIGARAATQADLDERRRRNLEPYLLCPPKEPEALYPRNVEAFGGEFRRVEFLGTHKYGVFKFRDSLDTDYEPGWIMFLPHTPETQPKDMCFQTPILVARFHGTTFREVLTEFRKRHGVDPDWAIFYWNGPLPLEQLQVQRGGHEMLRRMMQ